MTVREVDALRAKRGPSATSEPTYTCFSRAPLFRLGILMPFGEPASASPPGHRTSESGRRPFHSSVPASPRPSCRKGKSMPCPATDERSRPPEPLFHFLRIRCSTSSGFRVPLPGFAVPLPPDSMFHFLRIPCSTSSGIPSRLTACAMTSSTARIRYRRRDRPPLWRRPPHGREGCALVPSAAGLGALGVRVASAADGPSRPAGALAAVRATVSVVGIGESLTVIPPR